MTTPHDRTSELASLIAAEQAVTPSPATRAANWAGLQTRLTAAAATAATTGTTGGAVKLLVAVAVVGGIALAAVALPWPYPSPAPLPPVISSEQPVPENVSPAPAISPPFPPHAQPDATSWDGELAHLQQVHATLRDDRPAAARALVDEYVNRWPDGVFIEEIEAARVLATCATARDATARRTLAAFLRRWPDSLYGARVRGSCRDGERRDGISAPRTLPP